MCMQWDWGLERFASLAPPPQPRQFRLTTEPQNTRPFEENSYTPGGMGNPQELQVAAGMGGCPLASGLAAALAAGLAARGWRRRWRD